jgi:hypothetical protein
MASNDENRRDALKHAPLVTALSCLLPTSSAAAPQARLRALTLNSKMVDTFSV